jgi:hypothetical protein
MITKSDVVAQFKDLHRKCYTHNGYLVSTVPDEDSERVFANAKWHECYNKYASEHTYIYSIARSNKIIIGNLKIILVLVDIAMGSTINALSRIFRLGMTKI